jgi:hypothetical protein
VEINAKKSDINACINGLSPKHSELVYFIRIGVNTDLSPKKNEMQKYSDGQVIVTPPRLNGLRIKQQSFRKLMELFVWNYTLEKDLDEEDDSSINEDDSVLSLRNSPTSPPPLTAVSAAAITPVRASFLKPPPPHRRQATLRCLAATLPLPPPPHRRQAAASATAATLLPPCCHRRAVRRRGALRCHHRR